MGVMCAIFAIQRAVGFAKTRRLYLTKFEQSRISNAIDTKKIPNVSLIQPVRPPLKPLSPMMKDNQISAATRLFLRKKRAISAC